MKAHGIMRRFYCGDNGQYDKIGAFWDEMSARYPLDTLSGIGYGWENDTICYLIGRVDGELPNAEKLAVEAFDDAECLTLEMPDDGWLTYHGRTDSLDKLYDEIYREGRLDCEIEAFSEDGSCIIRVYRK